MLVLAVHNLRDSASAKVPFSMVRTGHQGSDVLHASIWFLKGEPRIQYGFGNMLRWCTQVILLDSVSKKLHPENFRCRHGTLPVKQMQTVHGTCGHHMHSGVFLLH